MIIINGDKNGMRKFYEIRSLILIGGMYVDFEITPITFAQAVNKE